MAHSERLFTLFPNLPFEIRVIIWKHALPGPRVVNLRQRKIKKTIGEWETETGKPWPPTKGGLEDEDADEEDDHFLVDLLDTSDWRMGERYVVGDTLREANAYDDDAYKAGNLVALFSDCPPPEILSVCREAFEVVSKWYQKVFSTLGSVSTTWICFELDTLYLRYDDFAVYDVYDSVYPLLDELKKQRIHAPGHGKSMQSQEPRYPEAPRWSPPWLGTKHNGVPADYRRFRNALLGSERLSGDCQ